MFIEIYTNYIYIYVYVIIYITSVLWLWKYARNNAKQNIQSTLNRPKSMEDSPEFPSVHLTQKFEPNVAQDTTESR